MKFNFEDINETIRIKKGNVSIKIITSTGLENDVYVVLSPSILVSGYGATEDEAKESFLHNLKVFVDDILELSQNDRDNYLLSLGFKQERLKNKNFSRAYVDSNGALQNLNIENQKTSFFEGVV